jgi:hypothetical protein
MYTIKLLNALIYKVIGNSHSKVPLYKLVFKKNDLNNSTKMYFHKGLLKRASTDEENSCKLLKKYTMI